MNRWPQVLDLRFAAALLLGAGLGLGIWHLFFQQPLAETPEGAPVRFFQIGTKSTLDTYFTVGELIAAVISHPPGADACVAGGRCGVPGVVAVAKGSAGSVANIRGIMSGRLDSGLAQADVVAWASEGSHIFEGEEPIKGLRAVANLYPEAIHLAAVRGSGIASVADLEGLRVSIDLPGSGTNAVARLILDAYGVDPEGLQLFEVGSSRAAEMILEGTLDAFFLVSGLPARPIVELDERGAITLVPIDGQPAEKLRIEHTYWQGWDIAEDVYPRLEGVSTMAVGALWVTSVDADPDLIHAVTRALFAAGNRETLLRGHPAGAEITAETAVINVPVLLHEGAERYYVEAGILVEP